MELSSSKGVDWVKLRGKVVFTCLECGNKGDPSELTKDGICNNPDCNPEKDEGGMTHKSREHYNRIKDKR